MNNLTDRLKSKADMISLGERIVWGSDTGLMLEAAERIAELEAQLARVGSYPVAEVVRNTSWQIILRKPLTKNAWDMSKWVGYELYARKNDSAGGE